MWIKKHGQLHKILYSISVCTHALCAHVNIIFANIYAHMYDVSSYVPTEPTSIHDISCDSFENPNVKMPNVCLAGYYNHRVFALNGMYPGGFCGAVGLHKCCWEDGPVMSCGTICTIWQEQIVSFKEQKSVDLHSALGICVSKCTFQGYLRIQFTNILYSLFF